MKKDKYLLKKVIPLILVITILSQFTMFIPIYGEDIIHDITSYSKNDFDIAVTNSSDDYVSIVLTATSGDYAYKVYSNNNTAITKYYGSETNLIIPSQIDGYIVNTIGDFAFFECESLVDITIPDNIILLGDNAFGNCANLTSINIPESINSIGLNPFLGTKWFENLPDGLQTINNITYAYKRIPSDGNVIIPDGVIAISTGAFSYCSWLTSISIPESVELIGNYAFGECSELKNIELKGIHEIGSAAFMGTTSLETFNIIGDVNKIGSSSFTNSGVKFFNVTGNLNEIKEAAFSESTELEVVEITGNVGIIKSSAFYNCINLKKFIINGNIGDIRSAVFYNCFSLDAVIINGDINIIYPTCFSYSSINSFTVNGNVNIIDNGAFWNCENLEYLYLGGWVKEIQHSAFSNCKELKNVEIIGNIDSIGNAAFFDTTNLEIVNFYGNIVEIGPGAFSDSGINEINIYGNVDIIKAGTFWDCMNLTSANFKGNINIIGNSSFHLSGIKNIIVDGDVEIIENAAFSECLFIETAKFNGNVGIIGNSAFIDSKINNFYIKGNVEQIERAAFSNNLELNEMYFGGNIGIIENSAFKDSKINNFYINGNVERIENSAFANNLELNEMYFGGDVGIIRNSAFKDSKINNFYINGNVERIESAAFADILELNEIYFGGNVGIIENSSFYSSNINKIHIDGDIGIIESIAFANCLNLNEISFMSEIDKIEGWSFIGCDSLVNINLSADVNVIEGYAFSGIGNLESVIFNGYIDVIDKRAFAYSPINTIIFKSGVRIIGDEAFLLCTNLTQVDIPSGIKRIESSAFANCSSLTEFTFPNSIEFIGNEAFINCNSLNAVYFQGAKPEFEYNDGTPNTFDGTAYDFKVYYNSGFKKAWSGYTDYPAEPYDPFYTEGEWQYSFDGEDECIENYLGDDEDATPPETFNESAKSKIKKGARQNDTKLKEYVVPDKCYLIGENAFRNCTNLNNITMTENLRIIEKYAFRNCLNLTSVVFPENISKIDTKAFYFCKKLEWVYFEGPKPELGKNVFDTAAKNFTIYYNSRYADSWKGFKEYKTEPITSYDLTGNAYPISNSFSGFNYPEGYKIPIESYQGVFRNIKQELYDKNADYWGGNCFGMALTSIMMYNDPAKNKYTKEKDLSGAEYGQFKTENHSFSLKFSSPSTNLVKQIEMYQALQKSKTFDTYYTTVYDSKDKKNNDLNKILNYLSGLKEITPLIVSVKWKESDDNNAGHALVVDTSKKPRKMSSGWYRIYLYDPNRPFYSGNKDIKLSNRYVNTIGHKYLEIKPSTGEWKINVGSTSDTGSNLRSSANKNDRLAFRDFNNVPTKKQEINWTSAVMPVASSFSSIMPLASDDEVDFWDEEDDDDGESLGLDFIDSGDDEFGFLFGGLLHPDYRGEITITNNAGVEVIKRIDEKDLIISEGKDKFFAAIKTFNEEYVDYIVYDGMYPDVQAKVDSYTISAKGKNIFGITHDNDTTIKTNGDVTYTVNEKNDTIVITSSGTSFVHVSFCNRINSLYKEKISPDIFDIGFEGYLNDGESITASLTGAYESGDLIFNVSTDSENGFSTYTYTPKDKERYQYITNLNLLDGTDVTKISFAELANLVSSVALKESRPFDGDYSMWDYQLKNGFNPSVYYYTANVSKDISSIKLQPEVENGANVEINTGSGYKKFNTTKAIPLKDGQNDIKIRVIKEGSFDGIYQIRVTKESSENQNTDKETEDNKEASENNENEEKNDSDNKSSNNKSEKIDNNDDTQKDNSTDNKSNPESDDNTTDNSVDNNLNDTNSADDANNENQKNNNINPPTGVPLYLEIVIFSFGVMTAAMLKRASRKILSKSNSKSTSH